VYRIVLEQVGKGFFLMQVIDGDKVNVWRMSEYSSCNSPNSAEAIDCNA
jgi:hypothetical protein